MGERSMSEPVMGWVVCRPRAARRVALLATALSLFAGAALPALVLAASDSPLQPVLAIESPKAAKGLMIDVAHAGSRLVAVGDRGHILYSDDQGSTWTQAKVPTRQLLTAVFFVDDQQGWASATMRRSLPAPTAAPPGPSNTRTSSAKRRCSTCGSTTPTTASPSVPTGR